MNSRHMHLGIDIGSVSVKTVLLDGNKTIVREDYTRTCGEPVKTTVSVLQRLLEEVSLESIATCSLTGSGACQISEVLDGAFVNEVIAQTKATEHFHPNVRTIIEIGGEDAKLILVKPDPSKNDATARSAAFGAAQGAIIEDFAMNSLCAAGTGSFLDQQAHRLGYTIEEFGAAALKSHAPPRIAGRCTVFAKTDMIHLQQTATPDFDIIAGLCFALARNLKSNLGKGKKLNRPIALQGGTAANPGVRRAFVEVLEIDEHELIVPTYFRSMGAIGAVLASMDGLTQPKPFRGIDDLIKFAGHMEASAQPLPPLSPPSRGINKGINMPATPVIKNPDPTKPMEVYLGIDVGSISTNVVLIDDQGQLVDKVYLMTAGRPLDAVKQGLGIIANQWADRVSIAGAGTTGSGRYLTGAFIGADIIRNEITAQAEAAANIAPEVDTIFEIGGQDSKFISLENGVIVDFMMNKVCAAGTGSFLEEQAEKLNLSIKDEFSRLALYSKQPTRLGERCTVFMESDLVHFQQQGCAKEDLVAGLCYSIVANYLNRVVERRKIGEHIFFQGGTALNQGIVAAFEAVLGKPVGVTPHCEVTGAFGAALLAKKERTWQQSQFKGFEVSQSNHKVNSFECRKCSNHCEIRKVTIETREPLFYGSRCERYERCKTKQPPNVQKNNGGGNCQSEPPDLFKERETWLLQTPYEELRPNASSAPGRTGLNRGQGNAQNKESDRGTIGIPRAMFFRELAPFFITLLETLGFCVVLSGKTDKHMIRRGVETVAAETCFPIKVAHGHILDLLDKGQETIFLPHVVDMKGGPDSQTGYLCPYSQTLPYTVHSSIDFRERGVRLLQPVLHFGQGYTKLLSGLKQLARMLNVGTLEMKKAADVAWQAQQRFHERLVQRGDEILSQLGKDERLMVMVSRPYNGFDPSASLDLPKKLRDIGVQIIPMDFLRLDEALSKSKLAQAQYWRFGQKILSAAHIVQNDPRLNAIYVTNFGCGPDSFISHFFQEQIKNKPYLEIEIDEHGADAGVITRLEAFVDSLRNMQKPIARQKSAPSIFVPTHRTSAHKVFIPRMTDQALALAAAFRACGVDAEALPESDQETVALGRRLTSGKECFPCILTTGDMAKRLNRADFDPARSAFFMPSGTGPCRYGQYHRFQRLVLDGLGHKQVPIYAPDQSDVFYKELGLVDTDFPMRGWQAFVAVDLLEKVVRQLRPYEAQLGATDRAYQEALGQICAAIERKQDVVEALKSIRASFQKIVLINPGTKPVVGIVGEIYTRANRFANENTIREIESLGGEVWMAPVTEWISYITHLAKQDSFRKREFNSWARNLATSYVQRRIEHKFYSVFDGMVRYLWEPSVTTILRRSSPYIDSSFRGEAVLSVGKSIEFIEHRSAGIVSIMPFTCMPGTIVNTVLKRCREEHQDFPHINLSYDGQTTSTTKTRLEAFMYQVKRHHYWLSASTS